MTLNFEVQIEVGKGVGQEVKSGKSRRLTELDVTPYFQLCPLLHPSVHEDVRALKRERKGGAWSKALEERMNEKRENRRRMGVRFEREKYKKGQKCGKKQNAPGLVHALLENATF
jgi:hypothetical protein